MSDKPKQLGERDGQRIDIRQDTELHYWTREFGISTEQLEEAVRHVGPMVSDIRRFLRRRMEESKEGVDHAGEENAGACEERQTRG